MVLARAQLDSGREIRLAALHMTPSYGKPIDEGWLRRRAQHLYDDAPIHIRHPDRLVPTNRIPPVVCIGLLLSAPLNPDVSDATQSQLVLIWWQEDVPVHLPHDLRWEHLAQEDPIW